MHYILCVEKGHMSVCKVLCAIVKARDATAFAFCMMDM